ncbi:MAG: HAD family hydrolase [Oscillospiraceae bacterium]|nr:HAD family hydrolase [Oscillospiraceae bacterium]
MKYRNYIFDLYGTLVDIHTDEDAPMLWEAMAAYYSRRGAVYTPAGLQGAYRRLVEEAEGTTLRRDAHEAHPEIRIELVFQQLFRDKGVDADLEEAVRAGREFRDLSTEYVRLYRGAKQLLADLRERGGGVWLLSNAQSIFTAWELERLGLADCFDGIYLSSDYGVKKPDRRFFDVLLQERGIPTESAVMIGNDGLCDIQGGRDAGLATIYVRSNLSPDEPTPRADHVLEHMDLKRVREILLEG